MRGKRYTTKGIILTRRSYSEADRILSIYSKDQGKVTLMAKGVRKPKSKKRGSLEVFSYVKFAASKGKTLDLMTEVEMIDSFAATRKSLSRSAVAYYLLEVIEKATREGEINQDIFDLLLNTLYKLQTTSETKSLKNDFDHEVLVLLGFWPRGKRVKNSGEILEEVLEKKLNSVRVGKRVLS